jgi:hypothetical protein
MTLGTEPTVSAPVDPVVSTTTPAVAVAVAVEVEEVEQVGKEARLGAFDVEAGLVGLWRLLK